MVDSDYRQQYQTRYVSNTVNDPDNTDVLAETSTLSDESQLTTFRAYAENAGSFQIDVVDANDDSVIATKFAASGVTEVDTGDFEDPVFETGAQVYLEVSAVGSITGDVSVNMRVDERTG